MRNYPNSNALWERAQRVLAGGPATLSKMPSRFPEGVAPKFLEQGSGAYIWDVDGFKFIDTVAALGPILLGHNDARVTEAVCRQASQIASSTLSTALEVEVAEMLVEMIPGAECCRFATNGKDVTEAAVKVARYVTGRPHIIYAGYHGGFSDYLITTDKNGGILPHLNTFNHQVPWGDVHALEQALDRSYGWVGDATKTTPRQRHSGHALAAIMLEVPPRPYDEATHETARMLQWYKEMAHASGALFIMDEIVTGLRYGLGGAQAYYSVQADMVTMSKALGNGYPVAAILGPRELLRNFDGGHVFLSTTFGANPIGLAACKATLETLRDTDALTNLKRHGDALLSKITWLLASVYAPALPVTIRGNYARFVFDWQACNGITADAIRTLWLQELCKSGILASVPWFSMCCWDDAIVEAIFDAIYCACDVIYGVVHKGIPLSDVLECPIITDVFQQRYVAQEPA